MIAHYLGTTDVCCEHPRHVLTNIATKQSKDEDHVRNQVNCIYVYYIFDILVQIISNFLFVVVFSIERYSVLKLVEYSGVSIDLPEKLSQNEQG